MNILFISHSIPTLKHIEAANIVQYELLSELIRRRYKISFLLLNNTDTAKHRKNKNLNPENINFFEIKKLDYSIPDNKRSIYKKIFYPKLEDYFPTCNEQNRLKKIIHEISPKFLLTIWDEKATNMIYLSPIKKICYYGNPLSKNFSVILDRQLSKTNFFSKVFLYIKNLFHKYQFKKFHFEIIQKIDFLFNVSLLDSKFYSNNNIDCQYINFIYKSSYSLKKIKSIKTQISSKNKIKITGNVGNLNGTANTLGLKYLIKEVFPELKKLDLNFEIHLFGSGNVEEYIKEFSIKNNELKVRGFVKDIDKEICNSNIFLCCNNATTYNVGHTRYLHAFSLGTCVVAHKNLSVVMPEMIDKVNCCLEDSPKNIACVIKDLSRDISLAKKIGLEGYQTLIKDFSTKRAVNTMIDKIKI